MLKITNTTAGALTAGTPITFVQNFNSNNNVSFNNNNTVTVNKAGHYNIDVNVLLTATSTNIGVQLYVDGNPIPETKIERTSVPASTYELVINDAERFIKNYTDFTKAQITIVPLYDATLVNANARVEYVK